ncbi:protein-L-isoaspartate(D-aspartate) O-methyltransferase [Haematospirillum jordaniae]|uniref:Protein-L-isoaspartate O-methyltransferase n=1 Tax=Haematospirillum jordaniae TaxID=1549855 RepID=A0A143DG07_9PROT|nr:protein-L-isoaspartate(D-aspartate) O-methyltransferase [Haematospirillum jordaniae]AMW35223.1 protein-L-isoaspartate O-methyltransferase [Haematospirillum jordaniae]NKD45623.1 protein-L-isoaspartate(D-aspartate) O-methyltransferase [Haematospirillum jordaniae]NKD56376.1 protein-L-isoaspartate(D-aspartate) O-methyltransferase [Haematospirillum jordaniae]NKD58434.1 protein-L-isoaspartate(D-aspartate) O-methyltransferase [Haematospirillum jordaniae]NKD66397.1 protein-L-isoaspartate(D-aspartat
MRDARAARLIMDLRQAGITDTRLLKAIELVPRNLFVDSTLETEAWEDRALPIGCGQTISQPLVVAAMTQALDTKEGHKVLEIGTGSGYQAAVLARLCRRIYSLERHRDLYLAAEKRFTSLGLSNVTPRIGDGWRGWPEQAPFDRIIVTAAASEVPCALTEQLAPSGVLVIPVGPEFGIQQLWRYVKDPVTGCLNGEILFPVRFVPMLQGIGNPGRVQA